MSIELPGGLYHYKEEILKMSDSELERFCKLLDVRGRKR